MKKKVYLHNNTKTRSTIAEIAKGTAGEIGIRGDICYSAEGDLIVEHDFYDDECELCYTTLVSRDDKLRVLEAIRSEGKTFDEDDDDWKILRFLESHFDEYKEVRKWLMNNRIPFRKFYDSNWGVHPESPDEDDAEQLARIAHGGQTDKSGTDYIEHPLRVANAFGDTEARIVALLHDALEDTWVTREYLKRSGYSEEIIIAIEALTKLPNEEDSDEGYEKFIRRAAQNPLALRVKIADLKDNMDLSRIPTPDAKDHARIAKYQKAMKFLEKIK